MRSMRDWSVRHAHRLARLYVVFEHLMVAIEPLARLVGHDRLERPVATVERTVKGALFDCRMCGACVLSSTGMSCPRNCPKNVLNGPCGGVRADGTCEVLPDMTCVWVKEWDWGLRYRADLCQGDSQSGTGSSDTELTCVRVTVRVGLGVQIQN